MIRFALCLFIGTMLTGCGLSARQAQNLSDGLAGIEAVQPQVATNPSATLILTGAHDHIEAVAIEAKETLPKPLRSPTMIAADATGYADNAGHTIDVAQHTIPWWGWLAGAGAAILGTLRLMPGAGGAVADAAWNLLAPTATQHHERRRDLHARGFQDLVALIEELRSDQTIAHLKAKVTTRLPSTVRDEIIPLRQRRVATLTS